MIRTPRNWRDAIKARPGMTADDGRIVVERHLVGSLWSGYRTGSRRRDVIIQIREFDYAAGKQVLDEWLRYEVPGIAPLAFLGFPDGLDVDADRYRELAIQHTAPPALVAEIVPEGEPIDELAPLTDADVVRLGLGLCDVLLAWAARRAYASQGFTPETVFVAGEPGMRYFAGAVPRVIVVDGSEPDDASFEVARYGGLMSGPFDMSFQDAAFMIGQVIWFAATAEHAYAVPGGDELHNMESDRRRAFTGNPEIGALLERVLVFDEDKRIDVHALRAGLVELARRWGVEMPPFPPPGLAD